MLTFNQLVLRSKVFSNGHDAHLIMLFTSARPGCIIELDSLVDSKHKWQSTQLLHAFQEQMILGRRPTAAGVPVDDQLGREGDGEECDTDGNLESIVDLRNITSFRENFYLVRSKILRNPVLGLLAN